MRNFRGEEPKKGFVRVYQGFDAEVPTKIIPSHAECYICRRTTEDISEFRTELLIPYNAAFEKGMEELKKSLLQQIQQLSGEKKTIAEKKLDIAFMELDQSFDETMVKNFKALDGFVKVEFKDKDFGDGGNSFSQGEFNIFMQVNLCPICYALIGGMGTLVEKKEEDVKIGFLDR